MSNPEPQSEQSFLKKKFNEYSGSVAAATRYVGTFAGGAAMVVGILGIDAMNQSQVDQLFAAFKQLGEGLSTVLASLGTIAGIASAVYGSWKATKAQQTKSVAQTPGVQVHVDTTTAPASVVAVAASNDPKLKDVVPMVGGPRDDKATGDPPPADAEEKETK